MPNKSLTCMGAVSKAPLTEYISEHDALGGARYALERFGNHLVPYRCRRCRYWHLSPSERQTPGTTCSSCHGRDGRPKASYQSEEAATRRAFILQRERHVTLRAYQCPYGGWHLTKG